MSVEQTLIERGNRYGDFTDHARLCQELKSLMQNFAPASWTTSAPWNHLSDVQKQALEVIADKIARILSGDPNYADNWHDIQGYAKLVEDRLHKAPMTFKERCAEIDTEIQAAATTPVCPGCGREGGKKCRRGCPTLAVQPEVVEDPFAGAPDWAKYKAQDEDGDWYWYKNRPEQTDGFWMTEDCLCNRELRTQIINPNWRETLIERPTK